VARQVNVYFTPRYGDKAPKSFAARLLTILWMITGTIVTSLFTANVTTVLTTKNVAALQNVLGQKVACLYTLLTFDATRNALVIQPTCYGEQR
jgi:hypothetical protein